MEYEHSETHITDINRQSHYIIIPQAEICTDGTAAIIQIPVLLHPSQLMNSGPLKFNINSQEMVPWMGHWPTTTYKGQQNTERYEHIHLRPAAGCEPTTSVYRQSSIL